MGRGDSRSRMGLVMLREERDGITLLSSTAGTTNTMHIVLDSEGELEETVS